MLKAKEEGKKLTSGQVRGKGQKTQRLMQLWERLLIEDGMLKRKYEDAQGGTTWIQLVVPKSLRKEIMQELHAGATGHIGEEKTLNKIKERFYWPGMWQDVKDWCHACATCATHKSATERNEHRKAHYDRRVHGEPYKEGDLVWRHIPEVDPYLHGADT